MQYDFFYPAIFTKSGHLFAEMALVSQITVVTKENGLFILENGLLFYRKGYNRSEKRHQGKILTGAQ